MSSISSINVKSNIHVVDDESYCLQMVKLEQFSSSKEEDLQVGDHVYQWCSWKGVPNAFQHHAIIMNVRHYKRKKGDTTKTQEHNEIVMLTILDFSELKRDADDRPKNARTVQTQFKELSDFDVEGILRIYPNTDKWHKVVYQAPRQDCTVQQEPAGTCTHVTPDEVELVLARANFLLRYPDILPDYNVLNANCECVAVWCKTGKWLTLQGSSLLKNTPISISKFHTIFAVTAAITPVPVQVPVAGLWGWLGYTTVVNVSLLSAQTLLLPALVGSAVVSVGVAAMIHAKAQIEWKAITDRLETAFWAYSETEDDDSEFTHWGDY